MSVLVDTSVWSLAFRKSGHAHHPAVQQLTDLLARHEDVVLTGAILQEILQGFRKNQDFGRVEREFEPFPLLEMDRGAYVESARLHRACASHGIAATTIDCQIAICAVRHEAWLLTADHDFERFKKFVPLQLVE